MTDYLVVSDAGVHEGPIHRTLAEARAARQEFVNDFKSLADFIHVVRLTYIPEPGAYEVTLDDAEFTNSGKNSVLRYKDVDEAERVAYGMHAAPPVWNPDYEWTE